MADVYPSRNRSHRRRRRRGRWLVTLLVLLVLLLVASIVLDRVGRTYAEREIAKRVTQQLASQQVSAGEPRVSIGGAPFLTQVFAGKYQEIKILLPDFVVPATDNKTLRMPLLDVRARDVRARLDGLRSGRGDIIATTVTATGTLDYQQVAALVGQQGLTLGERDGKMVGAAPVQALGQSFTVTGTVRLEIVGNEIKARVSDVRAEGLPGVPLVQNLIDSYAQRLSVDVPAPQLPLGLVMRTVEPRPGGLLITASGNEVSLNTAAR